MQGELAEEPPGSNEEHSEPSMESSWSTKEHPAQGYILTFSPFDNAIIHLRPRSDPLSQPALAPILNRSLPGGCLPVNKGTLAWGQDGLMAYAAHSNVVVVEPSTVQTFQCLTR